MSDASWDLPAHLGGSRAVTLDGREANRWPILTEEDESAVLAVLRDGDLSLHPATRLLEEDYRSQLGVRHALAHCNGTAALLAAFFALDLNPGDEILVPSATHWASVVPMLWVGAVPVFCESEPDRLGIDPADIERKITTRSRAIVVTHLWGLPCKMAEIFELAKRHDLKIIEDASHAQGATWRGRPCGSLGDISVISLQTSKLAPAGEGGIFLTNNDAFMERATCMGSLERTLELQNAARRFAGTTFGVKTRLSPISAAIARVQLKHLAERNAKRNSNLRYLSERLEKLGFKTYLGPAEVERVYFKFLIQYDQQRWGLPVELLAESLRAEGCEVVAPKNRYPLLHQQPLFTEGRFAQFPAFKNRTDFTLPVYKPDALPLTEAMSRDLLTLPVFPSASQPLLDQYIVAFQKVLAHADEIAHLTKSKGAAN